MMKIQIREGTLVQFEMLLPTQREIRELMACCGCEEDEVDARLEQAIHRITADIVASPTNHELWRDLAHAFGLDQELKWKYLHVAHTLQPGNFQVLTDLAFTYYLLGDSQEAISLMDKVIACANNDNDRAIGIEYINSMKFPESVEYPTLVRM